MVHPASLKPGTSRDVAIGKVRRPRLRAATRATMAALVAPVIVAAALPGCSDEETPRTATFTDVDYAARRFFLPVDPVDPLLSGRLLPRDNPGWIPPPAIDSLVVWLDDRNQANNGGAVLGIAYLDPRHGATAVHDSVLGFFDPLTEQEDFVLRNDLFPPVASNEREGYRYLVLDMLTPIGEREVLAATFRAAYALPGGEQIVRYGAVTSDTIKAKAIFLPDYEYDYGEFYRRRYWYPVRRLELRNTYDLGWKDVDPRKLIVGVRSVATGSDHFPGATAEVTYLRALGVDREKSDCLLPGFDQRIDCRFVFPALGVIVLPDLRPFALAAEDSVWPQFYNDLLASPPARPRYFVPPDDNRAAYDKVHPSPGHDADYVFDVSEEP